MKRKTDGSDKAVHFRMERFVMQNGEWYYTTREGDEKGPFSSKEDAEGDLAAYIRHMMNMENYGS